MAAEAVVSPAERPLGRAAALWSPHQRARLVRLCTAIVHDAGVGEDLAQETLLEAWRHQDRLIDPSGADAWLNAIARNVCRRWWRASSKAALPVAEPEAHAAVASPVPELDAVLERTELVELLERALALLPPDTRDALVGHYVHERSHAEIADQLGSSRDAVSMRVSRGRTRLRFLLETRFADDAVAEGWVRRDDAGWRATRLRCVECGDAGVWMRQDDLEVAFRCRACDPTGLQTRLPLDTPVFGGVVAGLRRPSAIEARIAAWSRSYWSPADGPGTVSCVRCAADLPMRAYVREECEGWSSRHGWYASCGRCGEEVSGSMAGLALAQPEVQAARRRESRLRRLPARDVVRDGQPAKVLAFAGPDGSPLASVVFLRDTQRLVHVDGG
jgi:RNA polymerase sigma-70 factor (ECF subfamily)